MGKCSSKICVDVFPNIQNPPKTASSNAEAAGYVPLKNDNTVENEKKTRRRKSKGKSGSTSAY